MGDMSKYYLPGGAWSCVRANVTEPCGDCGGCRYIAAVNDAAAADAEFQAQWPS